MVPALFPEHSAPVAPLYGRLQPGEVAVLMPALYQIQMVAGRRSVCCDQPNIFSIEEIDHFLKRTRLTEDTPTAL